MVEDIIFSADEQDLIVIISGTMDRITMKKFFSSKSVNYGYAVKSLEFSDGNVIDLTQPLPVKLVGTENTDTISGTMFSDTIFGKRSVARRMAGRRICV